MIADVVGDQLDSVLASRFSNRGGANLFIFTIMRGDENSPSRLLSYNNNDFTTKNQFAQFSVRKLDKFVKTEIKLPSEGQGNTEKTTQVEKKSSNLLKTKYLQRS